MKEYKENTRSVAAVASVIWSHVAVGRLVPPAALGSHITLHTECPSSAPGRRAHSGAVSLAAAGPAAG